MNNHNVINEVESEPLSKSAYDAEFADELIKRLGKIFFRLRVKANISVADLSRATGISGALIEKFEIGQHDIDIDTLIKLLDTIKVSMVDLFSQFEDEAAAEA